jgi:hypothetical protein
MSDQMVDGRQDSTVKKRGLRMLHYPVRLRGYEKTGHYQNRAVKNSAFFDKLILMKCVD